MCNEKFGRGGFNLTSGRRGARGGLARGGGCGAENFECKMNKDLGDTCLIPQVRLGVIGSLVREKVAALIEGSNFKKTKLQGLFKKNILAISLVKEGLEGGTEGNQVSYVDKIFKDSNIERMHGSSSDVKVVAANLRINESAGSVVHGVKIAARVLSDVELRQANLTKLDGVDVYFDVMKVGSSNIERGKDVFMGDNGETNCAAPNVNGVQGNKASIRLNKGPKTAPSHSLYSDVLKTRLGNEYSPTQILMVHFQTPGM